MMNLIEIESLSFSRQQRTIFSDINLSIRTGKVTAILGPSGTGKTTLLKLMTGALKPSSGCVRFEAKDLMNINQSELYQLRQKMGFLFQSSALFTNYSVYDNVAFPLRELTELPETLIRNIVLINLESVGLRGARNLYPNELSGGMSRRVALARALALEPKLMLYDEPFTGQDPINLGVLTTLIKHLNQQLNMTSVIVSHDVQEAMSIADWIYVIADGAVLAQGTKEDFKNTDSAQVQQFLNGLPDGPISFHHPACTFIEDLMSC